MIIKSWCKSIETETNILDTPKVPYSQYKRDCQWVCNCSEILCDLSAGWSIIPSSTVHLFVKVRLDIVSQKRPRSYVVRRFDEWQNYGVSRKRLESNYIVFYVVVLRHIGGIYISLWTLSSILFWTFLSTKRTSKGSKYLQNFQFLFITCILLTSWKEWHERIHIFKCFTSVKYAKF